MAMHSIYASAWPWLSRHGQASLPRPMIGKELHAAASIQAVELQLPVEGLSEGAVIEWVIGQ